MERKDLMPGPCEPWNRDSFMQRVDTFTVSKWHGKGVSASPLRCARFGWSCIERNVLFCKSCRCKVNAFMSFESQDQADAFYLESHRQSCPWRINQSPASFEKLPGDSISLRKAFDERMRLLEAHQSELILPLITGITSSMVCTIHSSHIQREIVSKAFAGSSLPLLALCGWTCLEGKNKLSCGLCNRVIGLWNFVVEGEELPSETESLKRKVQSKYSNQSPSKRIRQVDPKIESEPKFPSGPLFSPGIEVHCEMIFDGCAEKMDIADPEDQDGGVVVDAPVSFEEFRAEIGKLKDIQALGVQVLNKPSLDPFLEHRWFCQWKSPEMSSEVLHAVTKKDDVSESRSRSELIESTLHAIGSLYS